jgi:hypothetical protein
VSHTGRFFTSLAVQLADVVPSLQTHIRDAVRELSNTANLSLFDLWRELVIRLLLRVDKRLSPLGPTTRQFSSGIPPQEQHCRRSRAIRQLCQYLICMAYGTCIASYYIAIVDTAAAPFMLLRLHLCAVELVSNYIIPYRFS